MKLPPSVIITSLSGFCVCHFKDAAHDPSAPLHYHISIPLKEDDYLLFVLLTSQLNSKIDYYNRTNKKALNSIISIEPHKDFPFIYKDDTVIDCNQPVFNRKQEFFENNKIINWENDFEIKLRDIPTDLKKRIVSALKNSPIVIPYIKNLILDI
jgi:hypothetical protein